MTFVNIGNFNLLAYPTSSINFNKKKIKI